MIAIAFLNETVFDVRISYGKRRMDEENPKQNELEVLQEQVSSFASGIDDSLSLRLKEITTSQEKQLEEIRHEILIKKTLFEIETKRSLDGADEKTVLALAKAYSEFDLEDEHE